MSGGRSRLAYVPATGAEETEEEEDMEEADEMEEEAAEEERSSLFLRPEGILVS